MFKLLLAAGAASLAFAAPAAAKPDPPKGTEIRPSKAK